MGRLHYTVAVVILAATGVTPAGAQTMSRVPAAAEATGGDARAPAWRLLGGYAFSPSFGLEAAYADLGRYGYLSGAPGLSAAGDVRMRAWSLGGAGQLPLGARWSVTGRVGIGANLSETARAGLQGGAPWSAIATPRSDLYLGLGLGYSTPRGFGLRFEYQNLGKGGSTGDAASRSDHWAVNLRYAF
ncbi:MAG: outer membrane beta-barrel protein [Burkholderiales bacterium]|nr:outer membrane beta-barrel protein [Burkholderiales bacterium]